MTKQTNVKKLSQRIVCGMILLGGLEIATVADELKIGSKTQDGTLEAYDGRNFKFYNKETGKVVKAPRTSVKQLKVDPPRKGDVVVRGKKAKQPVLFHGYANGKFLFVVDNKPLVILGMNVIDLTLDAVSRFGGTSESIASAPSMIPDTAIQALLSRTDLTASQKLTLENFRDAKAKYDKFLAESSELVAKMDKMSGAARQAALNDLRLRKEAEQPLKREQTATQHALIKTFPSLLTGNFGQSITEKAGGTESSATIIMTLPPVSDGEILIVDTTVFKQLGNLTDAQTHAIANYESAVEAYQQNQAAPFDVINKAEGKLNAAQQHLFKAFPSIRIERGGQ